MTGSGSGAAGARPESDDPKTTPDRSGPPPGESWTAAHPVTPRAFFTVDAGTATVAAALVGRVARRWRLLAATAGPAGTAGATPSPAGARAAASSAREAAPDDAAAATQEAALLSLVDRVRDADPELAASVGVGPGVEALSVLPRVTARSATPRTLAVVAATEASLRRLMASAAGAGWRVVGSSAERADPLEIMTFTTRPTADAVLVGIMDPPGSDERDLQTELATLASSVAERRPQVPVFLSGPFAELPTDPDAAPPGVATPARLPASGPEPGASNDPLLLALSHRRSPDDVRAGLPRAAGSLARVLGLRVELLEIGAAGAIRARAEVSPVSGDVEITALEVPDAALLAIDEAEAMDRVEAWLTLGLDRARLRDRLGELALSPWADVDGEGAILRAAALRASLERLELATDAVLGGDVPDLVVLAGGAFSAVPGPVAALLVADVLRRPGAVTLALDHARLLGPLGTVADDGERDTVTRDLAGDMLVPLGTLVIARGLRSGRNAGTLVVAANGSSSRVDLVAGHLEVVDLPPGAHGVADLTFRSQVDLGPRGRRFAIPVTGGLAGLLVDLRDVPLRLPERPERRREVLGAWERAMWPEHDR